MPPRQPSFWTLQDSNGIYQFDNPGAALAAMFADPSAHCTLTDPSGFRLAGISIQGVYSANQSIPVVLQRLNTIPPQEFAVLVGADGIVRDGPFGPTPLAVYLQYGWGIV